MHKIGAHVSAAGGYANAIDKLVKIGGNCLQLFSSSPRSWKFDKVDRDQAADFKQKAVHSAIDPVYFHASYLINLADDLKTGHLSKMSLINEMGNASMLDIRGSIIHLGSYKSNGIGNLPMDISQNPKYSLLITNILEVLAKTPSDTLFIVENSGNRKIGQSLDEISQIVKDVNNERVKICLDTCHLFSAGYEFETENKLHVFLDKLDELDLLDKLELWHVNDSRDPFNSGRDRHANIGEGSIPSEEFRVLLNHPKTKNLPFILETPGFDDKGPDQKNLDIIKSLADGN